MAEDPSMLPEDDTFFIGRATRILPAVESDLGEFKDTSVFTPVVMRVEAAIRGQVLERVVVMDAGGTLPGGVGVGGEGTIGFRAERRYVVVGSLDADGTYRVDACTDTGLISEGEARTLIRVAGGREATRPLPISDSANSGSSNTLVILLAFLAGAGVSTVVVLARRHRLPAADRHESGAG
jgi:hypothetical protein